MAHVSDDKKKAVQEIAKLVEEYPVIGIVNMQNLPTKTQQSMRAKLRGKGTVLKMTKKRLMKIAFSSAKKEHIKELEPYFTGMPALVFTKENPFKLYNELEKTKSHAPARPGQIAPKDITVKAGPTSFAPGPIIGQLGKYGIKTGVESGKLAIKADAVVARKGQVIDADLAGILIRLGIEPMEIGLGLMAAYENGLVFTGDVLYVDEKAYLAKFMTAYTESLNLAVYSAFTSKDTIKAILGKVGRESRGLSLSTGFVTADTATDIIKKAYIEMLSISAKLSDDALSQELRGKKAAVPQAESGESPSAHEHKEEKKEDPDAAAGLGSLFG
ncbi:MAG: 50S ribosomal protein L10 [archaeon]